jgi:16S rRNA (cytidine1402-2'-O)-methyltransferase
MMSEAGTLYIVATPIGNRDDISLRAINILKSVDSILAEDTRHSKQLLLPIGITTPLLSLHAHNEADRTEDIIAALQQGKSFALISDAGTPLISDPGFPLVRSARNAGIPVVPIPGACALIAALSASGAPCDTFTFMGFLPAKSVARSSLLASLSDSKQTVVFYESTHRIKDCLEDITRVLGDTRELVLAKELTKTFETFVSGNVMDIQRWLGADAARSKGEFILIIPPREITPKANHEKLLSVLLAELPLKQAVKIVCQVTGEPKNDIYQLALSLSNAKT